MHYFWCYSYSVFILERLLEQTSLMHKSSSWDTIRKSLRRVECLVTWNSKGHVPLSVTDTLSMEVVVIVQLPGRVWLFATPWTAAHQASLSLIISLSLSTFMSIALMEVARSNHKFSVLSLSEEQHEAGVPYPWPHGPPAPGWLWLCRQHLQRGPAHICGLCSEGVYFPGQEAGLQGPSDHHGCLLGPLWNLGGESPNRPWCQCLHVAWTDSKVLT